MIPKMIPKMILEEQGKDLAKRLMQHAAPLH